ncbi:hypothetical protein D1872_337230 [compost metagenome]
MHQFIVCPCPVNAFSGNDQRPLGLLQQRKYAIQIGYAEQWFVFRQDNAAVVQAFGLYIEWKT